jgi:hypothetical protein
MKFAASSTPITALRARLEQGLRFGQRKADKHDGQKP